MSWLPRSTRVLSLCVVFLAVFCLTQRVSAQSEQSYLLRYKLAPKQSLHFVTQNDTQYVVEYSQVKEDVEHTSMSLRSITVLGVDPDGVADVELVIQRACMTSQNGGVSSKYDSAHPESVPTEFAGVHGSIGRRTRIQLSPLGQVFPAKGSVIPVAQDDLFVQLPESPVAVGGTWKEVFEIGIQAKADANLLRPVKMQRRYELKSVDGDIATISVVTVSLTPISDPFQESQLIQRKHAGTLKFDLQKGCLVERILKIDDKSVGYQGQGSALTVKTVKVDRQLDESQISSVDLTKPLVPVKVTAEALPKKN